MEILLILLGGALTLAGGWLQQLLARRQAEHERQMEIRREAYLGAVEALSKMPVYLVAFGNTNLNDEQRQGILSGQTGWLEKVHLVASEDTVEILSKLGEQFVAQSLELYRKRAEVDELRYTSERVGEAIDDLAQRNDSALAELRQLAEAGAQPAQGSRAYDLLASLAHNRREIEVLSSERIERDEKARTLHRQLVVHVQRAAARLQRERIDVLLELRRELSVASTSDRFRKTLQVNADRMGAAFEKEFERFDQQMEAGAERFRRAIDPLLETPRTSAEEQQVLPEASDTTEKRRKV